VTSGSEKGRGWMKFCLDLCHANDTRFFML
jgi:hypothetical protein